jgi:hypothetical protein
MSKVFVGPTLIDRAALGRAEARKRRARIIAALKRDATPERQGAGVAESKVSSTATDYAALRAASMSAAARAGQ